MYGAKTSAESFKANRKSFQPTETNSAIISKPPGIGKPLRGAESNVEQDGAEALNDFCSIQGDFIYRHHIEPQLQFYVPKEETFSIPLQYIDVTRSTYTNLDVLQEKRIDDYWNVNGNQSLSGPVERIDEIYVLKRETSEWIFMDREATQERRS